MNTAEVRRDAQPLRGPQDLDPVLDQAAAGCKRRGKRPKNIRRAKLRQEQKEHRFRKDVNHRISKRLVAKAKDTGRGIASTDLPHVFEPFFSTKPQGTGIGLAVAHRIVHEHGGDIEVLSALGLGTTFVTTLPTDA